MKLHACPDQDSGIFVYLFTKADNQPGNPAFIQIFHIYAGKARQLYPKEPLQTLLQRLDPDFVSEVIEISPHFFSSMVLKHIEAQPCDPFRLIYAHHTNSFVCDFKMGNGRLTSYCKEDKAANKALRLQLIPKVYRAQLIKPESMFFIVEKDLRSSIALNVPLHDVNQGSLSGAKFKFMSPIDRNYLCVIPIRARQSHADFKYCVVVRKQSVSILHSESLAEFKLIIRPQAHELDFFDQCYVTGMIPDVQLHYFEQVHKEEGNFSYRSYNMFDLHHDFWQCLKAFKKNLPINKKKVIMVKEKVSIMKNLMYGLTSLRTSALTQDASSPQLRTPAEQVNEFQTLKVLDPKEDKKQDQETSSPSRIKFSEAKPNDRPQERAQSASKPVDSPSSVKPIIRL